MMKSKRLLLLLLMALLVPWAAMAQECEISYTLTDSYGDGWNGGTLVVTDATTSTQLASLTISSGSSATGTIPVTNGHEISFAYTAGSYAYENSWVIYDPNGAILWEGTGNGSVLSFTYTAVCPSCIMPQALAVTLTPGNGTIATLSWTAGGTETNWVLEYGTASDFTGATSVNVSGTPTQNLSVLTAETTYYARVKADCGDGDESEWTAPISFIPTNAYSITVNDGTTTNGIVPIYGSWVDNYSYSQFIIPAGDLNNMIYGTISKMVFYGTISGSNPHWDNAQFEVYMMETRESTLDALTDWTEMVKVMNAAHLEISDGQMVVTLDDPFQYMGGNLMIGIKQTVSGSYSYCTWQGVAAEGASMGGYGTSVSQQNFLPKTTFEYTPGVAPTCLKPTGLTVSNITAHTAELSWTENGDATEWEISYELEGREFTAQATTNPFTLTGLEPDAEYTVKVRANCGEGDYSDWTGTQTFTTDVACHAPTNLIVSDITVTSAVVSWTGDASSYNLRYRELTAADFATITFTADDVWQDGTGYQMLLDADATAYGTIIPVSGGLTSNGSASAAVYAEFEYKIPENADGATTTTNVLIAQSVSILVPAGTYDYCITNPTPGDRIWIAGGDYGRQDDYVFEAGKTYEFHVQSNGDGGDEVVVTVTEPGTKGEPKAGWTEINGVTSPYTITVEGEKDYVVEVQADCGAEGTSVWTSQNFQTPSNCQTPTPLDATEVTANSATLNWTGVLDSYQVQYRTAGSRELLFFEDFDGQPTTWTLTNAVYNRTSSVTTDYFVFLGSGYTEAAYMITPELTGFENGGTLEFMHRAYNGTPTFQVGFSTTTNDVDAFTWGSEVAAATGLFGAYSVALPNGTKYVAITTTTETSDCCVLINDFGIYGNEIPAGSWNTATANATSLPISGLIGNTQYEWQVRGVNSSCDGGYTEWSTMVTFTTEPSCLVPTNLSYNNGMLSWTSDATSFDIQFEGEEVIEGVSNPYTPELDPETIYSVRVRANCGDGDYSDWTEYYAFVTECNSPKDLPYTFGFEKSGEFYACWSLLTASGNNNSFGITSYDEPYDGSNVFVFSSYTNYGTAYDQYLVSPELNTEAAVAVEFYYRTLNGYGSGETFKVGYSTDGEEFTWGDEISTKTTEWTKFEETFPAGTMYVAIHYYSNYQYYLFVDGFSFTEVTTTVTQSTELTAGWNWFSTFIAGDAEELLWALEESLGDKGVLIKSKEFATDYLGEEDGWDGDLEEVGLTNEKTYMIKTSAACTVTLEGMPVDPATVGIEIKKGWNWIGFPFAEEVSVAVAFADFPGEEGDILKTLGASTDYYGPEDGWDGDLETMEPGKGYMYYSVSDTPKTLVFSAGTGSKAPRAIDLPKGMPQKEVANKQAAQKRVAPKRMVDGIMMKK